MKLPGTIGSQTGSSKHGLQNPEVSHPHSSYTGQAECAGPRTGIAPSCLQAFANVVLPIWNATSPFSSQQTPTHPSHFIRGITSLCVSTELCFSPALAPFTVHCKCGVGFCLPHCKLIKGRDGGFHHWLSAWHIVGDYY